MKPNKNPHPPLNLDEILSTLVFFGGHWLIYFSGLLPLPVFLQFVSTILLIAFGIAALQRSDRRRHQFNQKHGITHN